MHVDLYEEVLTGERRAVGILGAGRQAHETAGYYLALGAEVRFFAANEEFYEAAQADPDLGAEVLEMEQAHEEHPKLTVITAVGYAVAAPAVRRRWPGARWDVLVAERAWVAPDAELGEGTQIARAPSSTAGHGSAATCWSTSARPSATTACSATT